MNTVRSLKVAVLLVGALVVLVMLYLAVQDGRQLRISTQPKGVVVVPPDAAAVVAATSATAVLKKARYEGEDAAGNRWNVAAVEAVQDGGKDDAVLRLKEVVARWEGRDAVALTAGSGLYAQTRHTLVLDGGVTVEGGGLVMKMRAATADLLAYAVESFDGEVEVTGKLGGYDVTMTGERFMLTERGNKVALRGKVHGILVD